MSMNRTSVALAVAFTAIQGDAAPGAAFDREAQALAEAENPSPPKLKESSALGSVKWKSGAFLDAKLYSWLLSAIGAIPRGILFAVCAVGIVVLAVRDGKKAF